MALTAARSGDKERFQELLTNIAFHPNYDEVEKAISDTLLAHDELSTYRVSFDVWYVSEWCNKNAEHAIRNCPEVFQCWADTSTSARRSAVRERIAEVLESMPESARLALLENRSNDDNGGFGNTKAHKMLYNYLANGEHHWSVVSPQWGGLPGSQLRQAARELGWEERHLPAMIQRNAFGPTAGEWLGRIPYAYTMLACEENKHAESWMQRENKESRTVL